MIEIPAKKKEYDRNISWRYNALAASEGKEFLTGQKSEIQKEGPLILGKRVASEPVDPNTALVSVGITSVIANQFEVADGGPTDGGGTPQKSANRKKLKGSDGMAVESNKTSEEADSQEEDRPAK